MKISELLILAGAAGFAWYLLNRKAGAAPVFPIGQRGATGGSVLARPEEVLNQALPGQPGWGWTYYSDGTAIGPDGAYYKNGVRVWSPPK